jgi:hypothetical protein
VPARLGGATSAGLSLEAIAIDVAGNRSSARLPITIAR